VPDFSDTRSLIICKQHHSICDGIATLVMVSMLTDDGYKRENFPTTKLSTNDGKSDYVSCLFTLFNLPSPNFNIQARNYERNIHWQKTDWEKKSRIQLKTFHKRSCLKFEG
jgi:hypothetical protein